MSTIIHLDANAEGVKDLAELAFPAYKGKKFKIVTIDGPVHLENYWSDGSMKDWAFIKMPEMQVASLPVQNPMRRETHQSVEIPRDLIGVCHTIFCGKDMGLSFYLHPENIVKFLPEKIALPKDEMAVLTVTKCYKSSYRFEALRYDYPLSQERYDTAKASLIAKGLLAKNGSITPSGRNQALSDVYKLKEYQG